ncbi:hypothetical protein LshimejAT787_0905120 [Lyophyllum shimeji]|uniref:C2H2-type domain-containing protein n=1 Tax=Lyophyllum shimeji TaxID=47721 RepID=A0A9P3PTZ2_LYOSH|nr:hypothetical protein LshimejAT787_0905120 [Lyophyllum shimeji]
MYKPRKPFVPALYNCTFKGCRRALKTARGLKLHYESHIVPRDLRFPPNTAGPSNDQRDQASPPPPPAELEDAASLPPQPPSPTFSSRRAPCRTPSVSPQRTPESPRHDGIPVNDVNSNGERIEVHPLLDGIPCDADGFDLADDALPPPPEPHDPTDFSPFPDRAKFEYAEFLFTKDEMSASNLDKLLTLTTALNPDRPPPFSGHQHMYGLIDAIKQGDVPWQSFSVTYQGQLPDSQPVPSWMLEKYEVWFRDPLEVLENQIGNPDFDGQIDYAPKRLSRNGKRRYRDLMSGNWAWEQCDKIAVDESTHGASFAPVILGSDKTTVSVATGQNEYYPLYASHGGIHNSVRRAHRNAVALISFLAIPKTSRDHKDSPEFRKFRRQLFHASLEHILSSLRPHMTKPRVTKCADGHYRRVIYGLGPYIADYPEQALLACIVQNWCAKCTGKPDDLDGGGIPRSHEHTSLLLETFTLKDLWESYGIVGDLVPFTDSFPRADIHELLAPDLLHQIIKGTFKDHLVDWVEAYIKLAYKDTPRRAAEVLADIDRRQNCCGPTLPRSPALPAGQRFQTVDRQRLEGANEGVVYLAAIHGHVPAWMTRAVAALIDFCYLVRRSTIDEDALASIQDALSRFHHYREVFRNTGVRPEGFSLPRQHSLTHYPFLITQFGAPNGICSSITESKHIKAVKRPYRRSNKNKPLGQMLVTNQRLDKLAAARVFFNSHNMLSGPGSPVIAALRQLDLSQTTAPQPPPSLRTLSAQPLLPPDPLETRDSGEVDGPRSMSEIVLAKTYVRKVPSNIHALAAHVKQPDLPELASRFLYNQLHPDADIPATQLPRHQLPVINSKVRIFNSARAVFYAPSDLSGVGGMRHERIRAARSWYGGAPRYDCVFVGKSDEAGFRGLHVARVFLLFSFIHDGVAYPYTGMWMVEPDVRLRRGCLRRVLETLPSVSGF